MIFSDTINENPTGLMCEDCGHVDYWHNNYGVCFTGRIISMAGDECMCETYNPTDIWMNKLLEKLEGYNELYSR